jgi:ring-1,2-phenylacetyl-CoA epoxidase subunit PaaB
MSDTQWPRYEVFGQDKEGRPHRNVGSVHAVDPEMALQNARDVFVRRPQTTSIWVVPAANILSKTQQEISEYLDLKSHVDEEDKKTETYLVFQKLSQRPSMTFVVHTGQVEASSAIGALKKSVELFGEKETYVWWVFPEIAVFKSTYDDIDCMFSQAHDKKYRMPQDYRLTLEMMELKRGKR